MDENGWEMKALYRDEDQTDFRIPEGWEPFSVVRDVQQNTRLVLVYVKKVNHDKRMMKTKE